MGVIERVRSAFALPPVELLTGSVQIPDLSGDVAQVIDLPPEVAAAFGINTDAGGRITRRDAMRVPAFLRGRNVICGTIGTLELGAWRDRVRVPRAFLDQPDPDCTLQHTLTWTIDDLLCEGIAWWEVLERDAQGFPSAARRLKPGQVQVDAKLGRVYIDGKPATDRDVIRFDGFTEGVLYTGGDVLRGALALERLVGRYADNPQPQGYLYDKRPIDADTKPMPREHVDNVIDAWVSGNRETLVRFLNRTVGYEGLSWDPTTMDLTGARQQAAVQIARMLNLPSRQVNAPSETGMTYSTTMADRLETLDTLSPYLVAVEQRLSMGDVTPRGTRSRFDRDTYATGTTKDRVEVAAAFLAAKLGNRDEARERFLGLGPAEGMPDETAPPAAPPAPAPDTQETPDA